MPLKRSLHWRKNRGRDTENGKNKEWTGYPNCSRETRPPLTVSTAGCTSTESEYLVNELNNNNDNDNDNDDDNNNNNNNNTLYLNRVTRFALSNFRLVPVEMRLLATTSALAYSYRRVCGLF